MKEGPNWEKSNLSLEEAAAYSGIGMNKLRDLTNDQKCRFVLWVENKHLKNAVCSTSTLNRRILSGICDVKGSLDMIQYMCPIKPLSIAERSEKRTDHK